jgi:energy-coupling factor transporter ATP-binding protein EcfA2
MQIKRNPFSTCFTEPGKLSYIFAEPEDQNRLLIEFERNGFKGQIVGPHGCGKTTLTMTLADHLPPQFSSIQRITLRKDGGIVTESRRSDYKHLNKSTFFVIDGIENMPWLHRKVFLKFAQQASRGLLLTTHQPLKGIPVLHQISPTFAIFQRIVSHISPEHEIGEHQLEQVFEQNDCSVRESLMSLYTLWQTHKQKFTPLRDTQSAQI